MPPCRVCPKASPIVGIKPGSDIEYWLRYDKLTVRTIIKARATHCAVLYQPLLSRGSLGVTVSFNRRTESVLLYNLTLFSSIFFHFSFTACPLISFRDTTIRFVFFACATTIAVSAGIVTSFSKLFAFFGSAFFLLSSFSFLFFVFLPNSLFNSSLKALASTRPRLSRELFLLRLGRDLLNLSFVFLKKGIWL